MAKQKSVKTDPASLFVKVLQGADKSFRIPITQNLISWVKMAEGKLKAQLILLAFAGLRNSNHSDELKDLLPENFDLKPFFKREWPIDAVIDAFKDRTDEEIEKIFIGLAFYAEQNESTIIIPQQQPDSADEKDKWIKPLAKDLARLAEKTTPTKRGRAKAKKKTRAKRLKMKAKAGAKKKFKQLENYRPRTVMTDFLGGKPTAKKVKKAVNEAGSQQKLADQLNGIYGTKFDARTIGNLLYQLSNS
ncbi:MAG: hypothetical protein V1838_04600 [Patescibacteria group bacterium]